MDPTEKDWLARYIDLRADVPIDFPIGSDWTHQKQIYKYLQPTGLLYGHPIALPYSIDIATDPWPVKERLVVILMESLLATYCIYNNIQTPDNDTLTKASETINQFYLKLYPKHAKKGFFEGAPKSNQQQLERIIAKRITVKSEWNAQFWRGFFQNILLFADIIVFLNYLKSEQDLSADTLQQQSKEIQQNIISLLSVIVHLADNSDSQNINFFHYFIESTDLSKIEKEEASKAKVSPDMEKLIRFLKDSDWLLKKYFLELGVLSIWADHNAEDSEKLILEELADKLNLDSLELEASSFAVESFVMLNWQQVHYLQSKQSYLVLSKRMAQRMTKISKKYGNQIKIEIDENKELVKLLMLSQERPLSLDEKEKVRAQLIDILKSIPAFVVLVMPMAFLTVPILMKILPKNLFPSSFDPNRMISKRGNRVYG